MAKGMLQVRVVKDTTEIPIANVKVLVSQFVTVETENKEYTLSTNSSGFTEVIELFAPSIAYSQGYSSYKAYNTCEVKVTADGYRDVEIVGVQILPEVIAMQMIQLKPKIDGQETEKEVIIIPDSQLVLGSLGEKNQKQIDGISKKNHITQDKEVIIPSDVIVHLGPPEDLNAENLKVRFDYYIKNVCSCEIYATWSDTAIKTNIYCIVSFVANRIFTEWYRNQEKNFDITSDPSYDQAFSKGRNTYINIDRLVDIAFSTYIVKAKEKHPVLTKYCVGEEYIKNSCILKWQSKHLADRGLNPGEIIRNYFGEDKVVTRAKKIEGIPLEYPGYPLVVDISVEVVKTIQIYINTIAEYYPDIPKVQVSGSYDLDIATAVEKFQQVFNLAATGIVDFATWYSISRLYISLAKPNKNMKNDVRTYKEGIFIPPIIDEFRGYVPTMEYPK